MRCHPLSEQSMIFNRYETGSMCPRFEYGFLLVCQPIEKILIVDT
jgi:hypothetical protein